MPGPGGGSHGGGFGGGSHGGSFGGSRPSGGHGGHHSGGSFGGSRPNSGHRGSRPGSSFGGHHSGGHRHSRHTGGGCLGVLLLPIIFIMFVVTFLFNTVRSVINPVQSWIEYEDSIYLEEEEYGEEIIYPDDFYYDEATFQDYANLRYEEEFSESNAYEDNLLIVFLTNESADAYYTIAWIGDNIRNEINYMFGDEYTEFGDAMLRSINDSYYAYSLDANLASVMEIMTGKIVELNLDSSFKSESYNAGTVESHVTNYTDFDLTEETINISLRKFTEETGIPAVIVIDSMESVFHYEETDSESEQDEVENWEDLQEENDIENVPNNEDSEVFGDMVDVEQPAEQKISVPVLIVIVLVIVLVIIIITLVVSARKRKREDEDFLKYNSRTYDE